MAKKIFVFWLMAVVCVAVFLASQNSINMGSDEKPLSHYNPEEHFERIIAEDQGSMSPDGDEAQVLYSSEKQTTGGKKSPSGILAKK